MQHRDSFLKNIPLLDQHHTLDVAKVKGGSVRADTA